MKPGRVQSRLRRRLVGRGERYLAMPGALMMLIAVGLVGASGWWSHREGERQRAQAVRERVEWGRDLLETALTVSLDLELTAYRNVVLHVGRDPLIRGARVSVGGKVVASTDLNELDRAPVPIAGEGPVVSSATTVSGQTAVVEVFGEDAPPVAWARVLTPSLVIAGCGLVAMTGVYRVSRRRMGEIGVVADALASFGEGERSADALRVDGSLGAVAAAWNELQGEREKLLVRRLVEEDAAPPAPAASGGLVSAAVGALPIGVLICGADAKSRYANTAAEIMLGSLKQGENPAEGLCGFKSPEIVEAIAAAASGRHRSRWATEIDSGNEQGTVFRVTVRSLEWAKEAVALVLVEDITKQRLAEQARSSFLARATHELRTPLTNIRLYAEQATDENESDPAERNRAINVINQETRRLERLVGDMLRSAEIENGSLAIQLNDLRLDAFLRELENDYRAQAEQKGIELVFNLPPKLPVIAADREKLALATHNLLGNALKYTGKGGRVEVGFSTGEDGVHRFVFKDTGFGISPEDQARLFDPYFRSSDDRIQHITGSGIGLGLARDVAKLHGGDITIESELGVGSTFTLSIAGASLRKAA